MNLFHVNPLNLARAVLWDLDGTLIDSNRYHFLAWQSEMASRGRVVTWEQFSATFGQRNDTILRLWLRPDINQADIVEIGDSKEVRYRSLVKTGGTHLLPGAARWLKELHAAGWRQALGTMAPLGNVEAIFASLSTHDDFDPAVFGCLMTAESVQRGKPDPEVWINAAQALGVQPSRCVVVEDSPAGIAGARSAGMHTVGVGENPDLSADIRVHSLADLPADCFTGLVR